MHAIKDLIYWNRDHLLFWATEQHINNYQFSVCSVAQNLIAYDPSEMLTNTRTQRERTSQGEHTLQRKHTS